LPSPRPRPSALGGEPPEILTSRSGQRPGKPAPRGPGRPRRNQAEQLNRELLEHALDHFLEKGFEATSVNAITSSLGMSKRTVYAWYGDKLSLFKAALERAVDEWAVPLEALQTLESDDLEDTLIRVGRLVVGKMLSPAGLKLIRITNAESYRMPEIGAYLYGHGSRSIIVYLADLLHRRIGPDPEELPDLDDLATAFLNLMSAPARLNAWGLGVDEARVDLYVRQRVRLFLRGVLRHETG
jgi:AcrR family transcriptional regulator